MSKVYFRQPKHTSPAPGRRDVGLDRDGNYATECSRDREFGSASAIGYALAESPEEARKLALQRLVSAEERGEKW